MLNQKKYYKWLQLVWVLRLAFIAFGKKQRINLELAELRQIQVMRLVSALLVDDHLFPQS